MEEENTIKLVLEPHITDNGQKAKKMGLEF